MRYSVRYEIKKNDFPKLAKRFPQEAADIQGKTVLSILDTADPNTPRDTGDMAGNVGIDVGGINKPGSLHWRQEYTGYVHNGTRFMEARPFIADACAQVWPEFQAALKALAQGKGL